MFIQLYLWFIASCVTSLHSPPSFSLSLSLSLLKPTKYHQVAGAPGRPQRVLQHQCVLSAIFGSAGGDHEGAHSVGCALPKPSGVGDPRFLFIPEGLRRGSRFPQVSCFFRWMRRTDIWSRVLYIIPAVLACPDRHSSCCSHGLCGQCGPSVAAGTSVSPDVKVERTPSAEGC